MSAFSLHSLGATYSWSWMIRTGHPWRQILRYRSSYEGKEDHISRRIWMVMLRRSPSSTTTTSTSSWLGMRPMASTISLEGSMVRLGFGSWHRCPGTVATITTLHPLQQHSSSFKSQGDTNFSRCTTKTRQRWRTQSYTQDPCRCRRHPISADIAGNYIRMNSNTPEKNNKGIDASLDNDKMTKTSGEKKATTRIPSSTSSATSLNSDPPMLNWIEQVLPMSALPYVRLARLDKPIGMWLLYWPCAWSTALAAASTAPGTLPNMSLLALFAVGAVVMRGAGCTINDLWDQDIDTHVQRTQHRPLVAGHVTQPQAITFLALQLSIGLVVLLSLPHTAYCFWWGAASLPLVAIYPTMKRFFPYPQLFLGLTMNWGAWMGWAAVHGSIDYSLVMPLYGSGVTWTLIYDTLYAHQDKHDDAALKLQSTALTFGTTTFQQKGIMHTLAAATWLQWLVIGYSADLSNVYIAGCTAAYSHLVWQIYTADLDDPYNLATRFRSNTIVGALVFVALTAGNIWTI